MMRTISRLLVVCLCVMMFSHQALFAQSDTKDDGNAKKTVKIGVVGPITGSGADFGTMIKRGSKLAANKINEAGGINGMKIELVYGDDQGKVDQAKLVAKKLAEDKDIAIVVGHFNSECSLAGKDTYQREGVVEFSPGSTNVRVCKGSEWTFRNLYRDDYQGTFLAQYIKNILGYDRVAVFFDTSDYGIGLKDAFVREAKNLGLEVVGESSYVRERTMDYSTDLDKLVAKNPQGIFVSGLYNEAAAIIKQARSKGIKAQFFGGDGLWSAGLTKIAGEAAEGTYVSTPFLFGDDMSKEAEEFYETFENEYGEAPDTWAALTYDAVLMACDTIATVGPDRKKIRDHFASRTTKDAGFEGITGVTYFDENGDCWSKPASVAVVKNGEFVPAEKQMR